MNAAGGLNIGRDWNKLNWQPFRQEQLGGDMIEVFKIMNSWRRVQESDFLHEEW